MLWDADAVGMEEQGAVAADDVFGAFVVTAAALEELVGGTVAMEEWDAVFGDHVLVALAVSAAAAMVSVAGHSVFGALDVLYQAEAPAGVVCGWSKELVVKSVHFLTL